MGRATLQQRSHSRQELGTEPSVQLHSICYAHAFSCPSAGRHGQWHAQLVPVCSSTRGRDRSQPPGGCAAECCPCSCTSAQGRYDRAMCVSTDSSTPAWQCADSMHAGRQGPPCSPLTCVDMLAAAGPQIEISVKGGLVLLLLGLLKGVISVRHTLQEPCACARVALGKECTDSKESCTLC